jgi:hypothetical protein
MAALDIVTSQVWHPPFMVPCIRLILQRSLPWSK